MRVKTSGKPRFHNLKLLSISTIILLLSIQGRTGASVSQQQAATPVEAKPELVTPPINPTDSPASQPPSSVSPTQNSSPSVNQPEAKPTSSPPTSTHPTQVTRLVIRLRERRVYIYRGNQTQMSYPIAIGKAGWETPTGTHKIINMQRDPAWQHPWTGQVIPPGPSNPLGTRWIAFWTDGKNFIGFHGTPNERLIGRAVSHGCIRMRNRDVQALFEQVTLGTPVTVEH